MSLHHTVGPHHVTRGLKYIFRDTLYQVRLCGTVQQSVGLRSWVRTPERTN